MLVQVYHTCRFCPNAGRLGQRCDCTCWLLRTLSHGYEPNNLANSQRHVEAAHRCLCSRCGAGLRGDTRRGRGPAASFRTVQRSLRAPLGQPRRTTYSLSLHCLWPLSPASTPVFGSGAAVFRAMLGAFLFSLQARLQETGMFSDNACIASALTCCVC